MADIGVVPEQLSLNALVADAGTATTVATGNTAVLTHNATVANHTAVDQVELSRLVVRLDGTPGTATATVTVEAGDNPPANRKVVGNLVLTVADNTVHWLTLEAANYTQSDGSIRLAVTGVGGSVDVTAFKLPDTL